MTAEEPKGTATVSFRSGLEKDGLLLQDSVTRNRSTANMASSNLGNNMKSGWGGNFKPDMDE